MGVEMLETEGTINTQINKTNLFLASVSKNGYPQPQADHRIQFFGGRNFQGNNIRICKQVLVYFYQPFMMFIFTDFLLAIEVIHNCTNIRPKNDKYQVTSDIRSVQTSECVMLFSESNCLGRSTKVQTPGTTDLRTKWESTVTGVATLSLLYKSFPGWIWSIGAPKGGPGGHGPLPIKFVPNIYFMQFRKYISQSLVKSNVTRGGL